MNILKKPMVIISVALSLLALPTTTVVSAAYPTSDNYNYHEPDGYIIGTTNYNDTFWVCGTQYARRKTNDTSVYVNNTSLSGVYVDVWGKKENSTTKVHVGCRTGSTVHIYADEEIWLPNNGPKFLNQFIFERNCTYACVYFSSSQGGSGYWSPDSVDSYEIIND